MILLLLYVLFHLIYYPATNFVLLNVIFVFLQIVNYQYILILYFLYKIIYYHVKIIKLRLTEFNQKGYV